MILRAYSIFDNKALQYHPPFYQATDGAAVRSLSDLVNDPNTNVGRHPGDFVLYLVGMYDDSNGAFQPRWPLVHIRDAVSLVALQPTIFGDRPLPTPKQPIPDGEF